jgi:glutaconate CoA-transferase subunit B
MDVTNRELQAIFISRIIENNWYVIAGIGAPIPRAGIMLAHLTHCPDLKIVMSDYFVEFLNEEELRDFTSYSDPGLEKNAEYTFSPEVRYETARLIDLMFLGGIQIDKFGNTNLIGIGHDFKALKLRGTGSIGAPSMASMVKRYIIFSNNHNDRTFVANCDFVSTVGWYKGGDSRKQLGLPGGGPVYVISPLCIMDFTEDTKAMRLKYLMSNIKKEEVVENTGFDLIIPEDISIIPPPTEMEIEILRKRVDPKGLLRVNE